MLEAHKQKFTLCAANGTPLHPMWAYLSYTSSSSRDGELGREHTFYYTAITRDKDAQEGMFLFDGQRRYRVLIANDGGPESILRLIRCVVFPYPASDSGDLSCIYDVLKERLGKDLLSGDGGVSLTLSVVSREEGIRNLRGELIAHAPTLGAAQAEALAVVASLTDLCEEENSPVLTVKRGLFRFRQDESGRGFSTVETVEICLSEGSGEDV